LVRYFLHRPVAKKRQVKENISKLAKGKNGCIMDYAITKRSDIYRKTAKL